jgi:3-deoxy-manno-octulosonate cytidylyltransferase (CMP-KDO synthetase)
MEVVDKVVVATDSGEIAEAVAGAGATVVLTRPDHPSGTDRVAEVVFNSAPEYRDFDVIVNVQGDEPFIPPEAVRGAKDMVTQRGFDLGTAAVRADDSVLGDPDVVKVVCADDGRALYFSRAAIPYLRQQADAGTRAGLVRQHLGVYAYSRDALQNWIALPPHALELSERLEQLRPLAAGITMGVALIDARAPIAVDTEDDLMRANAHWETRFATRS